MLDPKGFPVLLVPNKLPPVAPIRKAGSIAALVDGLSVDMGDLPKEEFALFVVPNPPPPNPVEGPPVVALTEPNKGPLDGVLPNAGLLAPKADTAVLLLVLDPKPVCSGEGTVSVDPI